MLRHEWCAVDLCCVTGVLEVMYARALALCCITSVLEVMYARAVDL